MAGRLTRTRTNPRVPPPQLPDPCAHSPDDRHHPLCLSPNASSTDCSNNRGVAAGRASTSTVPPQSGLSTPTTKASDGNPVPARREGPAWIKPPLPLSLSPRSWSRQPSTPSASTPCQPNSVTWSAQRSAPSPPSPESTSFPGCRKPDPAKSCAAPFGRSWTGKHPIPPRRSRTPQSRGIVKVLRPNTDPGEPMQPHHRLPDPVPVATKTTSAPGNRFAAAELAPPSAGSLHPVVGRYPQPPNRIDNDADTFGVHRPETPRTAVFRIIAGTYAPLRSFEHWPAMNSSEAAEH